MPFMAESSLKIGCLGGVGVPSIDTLKMMRDSSYILYILSVVGSSPADNSWEAVRNNTDFHGIRWSLAKQSKA